MAKMRNMLAVALFLCGCANQAARNPGPEYRGARPRSDLPGVENFAQVSPALYRGAQPTAAGFSSLEKLGVKTVVNLRDFHSDTDLLKGTNLKLISIPCFAWDVPESNVVAFLKVVNDPANQPVFVHCQYGSDRTGMMVAAYRMTFQNWPADDAAAELPVFGFHEIYDNIRKAVAHLDAARLREKIAE